MEIINIFYGSIVSLHMTRTEFHFSTGIQYKDTLEIHLEFIFWSRSRRMALGKEPTLRLWLGSTAQMYRIVSNTQQWLGNTSLFSIIVA